MSAIASRTLLARTAARSLKAPLVASSSSRVVAASQQHRSHTLFTSNKPTTRAFSATMVAKSGGPAPKKPAEFDKELVDMAAYAHGYKVDSDLAVCTPLLLSPYIAGH